MLEKHKPDQKYKYKYEYKDPYDIHKGFNVFAEIDKFEEMSAKLLSGELHEEKFKSFRLTYGIYGVRGYGEGMHMVRVKIPQGLLNSEQLRVLGNIVERYAGSGVGHITTRHDCQIHFVKLKDIPDVMRTLARGGLTTREACGNTVRNVTASPLSGICPDEIFDVHPYSMYTTRYFLRHPLTSTLPRKFKFGFSECEMDHAMVRLNDVGCVAQKRTTNGREELGFRVYVGGGLGPYPMMAQLFTNFIPVEDFYPLSEAIIRVFHRFGERRNRNRARMKFLIAKIGMEEFKNLVLDEFKRTKLHKNVSEDLLRYVERFPKAGPPMKDGEANSTADKIKIKIKGDEDFKVWYEKDVFKQKQEGYYAVYVRVPLGNLTPSHFRAIADISDKYAYAHVRFTQRQDVLIPWVKEENLHNVFYSLKTVGLIKKILGEIVACPGAYSCRLAVTHSYNLAEAIADRITDLHNIRVNISGCPNSCGQHHLADIGFYGASVKGVNGKDVVSPHYVLLLGGYAYQQKDYVAQPIMKIPAKNIPEAVSKLVDLWKKEKKDGEIFTEFIQRIGKQRVERILAPFANLPSKEENEDYYKDWGQTQPFKMEAASRGECAGSLIDVIAINIFEGLRYVYEAEEILSEGNYKGAIKKSIDAVVSCARALLYLEGVEYQDYREILKELEKKTIAKCYISRDFSGVLSRVEEWYGILDNGMKNIDSLALECLRYAEEFTRACDEAFSRLSPKLKIKALANCQEDENF